MSDEIKLRDNLKEEVEKCIVDAFEEKFTETQMRFIRAGGFVEDLTLKILESLME